MGADARGNRFAVRLAAGVHHPAQEQDAAGLVVANQEDKRPRGGECGIARP